LGHGLDPEKGVALAIRVQLRNLRGDPVEYRFSKSRRLVAAFTARSPKGDPRPDRSALPDCRQ
jgi:hypothetical protein